MINLVNRPWIRYQLRFYYVPGAVLGSGDIAKIKIENIPPCGADTLVGMMRFRSYLFYFTPQETRRIGLYI